MRLIAATMLATLALAATARAAVVEATPTGLQVKQSVEIVAPAAKVWAALGQIGAWWNPAHRWSGDSRNLSLELKAGGCWCEANLPGGGSARHMTVVSVMPGQLAVLEGALGPLSLSGATGHLVWQLAEKGGRTTLTQTYYVGGYYPGGLDKMAVPVDGVLTEELARTSRFVARLTGYAVQYNKAVVGRNAFAHEAGIHQHGVLADRETYEIIDAAAVGQEAAQIVLGKHSGRHAFGDTLAKMGLHLQGDALNQAFVRFKELADRKVEITEADLEAIVAEELGTGAVHRYSIVSLDFHGGTQHQPTAQVVLADVERGTKVEATGSGNGMIDAAFDAIMAATGVTSTVVDFKVAAVTGGGDALGDTVIQLDSDGRRATGRGVSTDVFEASARAYLNAVNKLARLRDQGQPRERTVGP